jgi:hypothetical protein
MSVSSVTSPSPIAAPAPDAANTPEKKPDANEGTRLPQPTLLAPLPPGQGTRIDQIA